MNRCAACSAWLAVSACVIVLREAARILAAAWQCGSSIRLSFLQALVRAGILRGVRGPRGGYRLARERRRISVREIFEVIENIDGNDADMLSKSDLGRVVIAPFHANMQEALIDAVGDTTIADLCSQADMSGGADKADFNI